MRLYVLELLSKSVNKAMAPHSSTLAWKIPWMEEPGRLQSMGVTWDSPAKNTGAGCHFLLQCMKEKSESEVAQSCPTLRDPMDCSLPGSSIHWICQARALEWGAIAFSIRYYSLIQFISTGLRGLGHLCIYFSLASHAFKLLRYLNHLR